MLKISHLHKRRYIKRMLRKRLEQAGFQIEKISYMFFSLFPFFIINRILGNFNVKKKTRDELFNEEQKIIPVINTLFYNMMKIESHIIKYVNLPFGSSVIAVARKT